MLEVSKDVRAKKPVNGTKKPLKKRKKQKREFDYNKIIAFFEARQPKTFRLGLFLAVVGLAIFGLFMIYSASHYNANYYYGKPFYFVSKQALGFALGLIAMTVLYFLDYRHYEKHFFAIFVFAVVLLLLVFTPLGISKLGASRWIGFGSFSLQPSEIAKFAFVVFAAAIFSGAKIKLKKRGFSEKEIAQNQFIYDNLSRAQTQNPEKPLYRAQNSKALTSPNKSPYRARAKNPFANENAQPIPTLRQTFLVLAAGGILCALVLAEPNLSITMCLAITVFLMLVFCGVRFKVLKWFIIPAVLALPALIIAEPYRIRRLLAFVDPWANPKDEGFQLIQSLYGLGNGGLFGVGFGESTQKYMFLPFSESDFIFSIIGEEFGLVGCVLFLAVLSYIVISIFRVGIDCPDRFGKYLCFGIGSVIAVQSLLNIAVVSGSIPPTGLPLPFISFGGTSLMVFMGAIGVVLNVHKQNRANNEVNAVKKLK
ncbi:MAG: putative lipid II flippase FtsW [Christensenellaceae bacterium]|jgi:cell division protein FtsW (lipid II flippase)|nr:putative lipid II flippase FtsW [Christensenellaceae bacterium]